MACDSLTQQATRLTVTLGALPEGFCPSSMQELGEAIAQRLIVTPTSSTSSFAVGPIAPTSNVGPWLKDCEEWFVWSDVFAAYIPIEKQGFNQEQYFTTSGNFIVPDFIFKIRASAWGAGGGGGNEAAASPGSGGGGGGFAMGIFNVTPGQVIPLGIGTGGANGSPAGANGGNTTILTMVASGGTGGTDGSVAQAQGVGGGANGGDVNLQGQAGNRTIAGNGGDGGDSPKGGGGGNTDFLNRPLCINGTAPGGGGVGATVSYLAGRGADGAILIEF